MRKIPKKKQAVKKPTRRLQEGNVLWQKFRELGQSGCEEFKHLLACNRIPLTTFYSDTYLEKDLSKLPQKRARIYQSFFQDLNWDEFVPVNKPSATLEKEEKREKQQLLARKLGMNPR